MPNGLYINLNDGGPAMEITAGLDVPPLQTNYQHNGTIIHMILMGMFRDHRL
jgi:hypothetical protein